MNIPSMYATGLGHNAQTQYWDAYARSLQATDRMWNEHCERKRLHRDMTAEDLGLFDSAAVWKEIHQNMLESNAVYRRLVLGDAPYAFWLGADA